MKAVVAAVATMLLGTPPIWAALGKPVSSISEDQKRLGGELRRLSAAQGFAVH